MNVSADVVGGEQVYIRLQNLPDKLRVALTKAMTLAMIDLRSYIASSKLSGQVLKVRSGTLRRSITQRIIDTSTGVTGIVGTNVKYAAVHEYGFQGQVTVKEHLRKLKSGDVANVSSFSRRMSMPQRSFLRSGLKDKKEDIQARLAKTINEVASGSDS